MTEKLLPSSDLSVLFGIDIDQGAAGEQALPIDGIVCAKCRGKGSFIGWSGKALGKCFACDGTGIERHVAVDIKPGDCAKCFGSGEWRPGRPCFACDGTGREPEKASINVEPIEAAFRSARSNGIMRPRLRLADFTFSLAPAHGKNAGSIYVKRQDQYLGKVTASVFIPTGNVDADTKAAIISVASDPHNAAKVFGKRTGSCSCCGRELTNKESIDLGIGPICREKFGW